MRGYSRCSRRPPPSRGPRLAGRPDRRARRRRTRTDACVHTLDRRSAHVAGDCSGLNSSTRRGGTLATPPPRPPAVDVYPRSARVVGGARHQPPHEEGGALPSSASGVPVEAGRAAEDLCRRISSFGHPSPRGAHARSGARRRSYGTVSTIGSSCSIRGAPGAPASPARFLSAGSERHGERYQEPHRCGPRPGSERIGRVSPVIASSCCASSRAFSDSFVYKDKAPQPGVIRSRSDALSVVVSRS